MRKPITRARTIWRITRLCARHLDRVQPFWWKDSRILESVMTRRNDIATRCWRELIRQRTGD